jgi:hypothetical protein
MNFAALTALISGVIQLVELIHKLVAIAKQDSALDARQWTILEGQLEQLRSEATKPVHWRIDP